MLKLQVIGHLGKDCIVNTVNGKQVINFTVAHTEKYKDAQSVQHEKTTWVDCSFWSDKTALAQYLKKGTQVFVEGTPDVRLFQRNDGSAGASLALRLREIKLLCSQRTQQPGGSIPAASEITEPLEDVPF